MDLNTKWLVWAKKEWSIKIAGANKTAIIMKAQIWLEDTDFNSPGYVSRNEVASTWLDLFLGFRRTHMLFSMRKMSSCPLTKRIQYSVPISPFLWWHTSGNFLLVYCIIYDEFIYSCDFYFDLHDTIIY